MPDGEQRLSSRPQITEIETAHWESFVAPNAGECVGRFRLISLLGEGGYGYIWRAIDTSSDQSVAVKVFNAAKFASRETRVEAASRFLEGAVAMRKLGGQSNVVRVVDGPHLDGTILWFAMPVYEDRDLDTWLRRQEFDERALIQIFDDVLVALEAAHTASEPIVHRDVRPGNILVDTSTGVPRGVLADFDIAYYDDKLRSRETTTQVLGVSRYLAPEIFGAATSKLTEIQRRPENDLYALAVVILDTFSTTEPSLPASPKAILGGLRVARNDRPGIHPTRARRLASFLSKALSKEAGARFTHVAAFRREWDFVRSQARAVVLHWCLLAVVAIALAILGDWAWFEAQFLWLRALGALVVGVGSVGILAAWFGSLKSVSFRWQTALSSRMSSNPWKWGTALTVASFMIGVLAWRTDPWVRMSTVRLVDAEYCAGVDDRGVLTDYPAPTAVVFDVRRTRELRCPATSMVRVDARSLASLGLRVRVRDPVSVRTSLLEVRAPNVVEITALAKRYTLRGTVPFSHQAVAKHRGLLDVTQPALNDAVLQWNSDDGPGQADLLWSGSSVSLKLLGEGFLDLRTEGAVSEAYRTAAAGAKSGLRGAWGEIAMHEQEEARLAKLAVCPARCCPEGRLCEDIADCSAKWACRICRQDLERMKWTLRLEDLDWVDGISSDPNVRWRDVKACVTTGQRCAQQCVMAVDEGTPLAEHHCSYSSDDLHRLFVKVIGVRDGQPQEQVIAQTSHSLKLTDRTLCSGVLLRSFESRNGRVRSAVFSIRPKE